MNTVSSAAAAVDTRNNAAADYASNEAAARAATAKIKAGKPAKPAAAVRKAEAANLARVAAGKPAKADKAAAREAADKAAAAAALSTASAYAADIRAAAKEAAAANHEKGGAGQALMVFVYRAKGAAAEALKGAFATGGALFDLRVYAGFVSTVKEAVRDGGTITYAGKGKGFPVRNEDGTIAHHLANVSAALLDKEAASALPSLRTLAEAVRKAKGAADKAVKEAAAARDAFALSAMAEAAAAFERKHGKPAETADDYAEGHSILAAERRNATADAHKSTAAAAIVAMEGMGKGAADGLRADEARRLSAMLADIASAAKEAAARIGAAFNLADEADEAAAAAMLEGMEG